MVVEYILVVKLGRVCLVLGRVLPVYTQGRPGTVTHLDIMLVLPG